MLSGIKFIPRDQIDSVKGGEVDGNEKDRSRKSSSNKEKNKRKKKDSDYSSDDEGLERIKKGSRKKKWEPSDDSSSSSDEDAESGSSSEGGEKRHKSSKHKGKRRSKSDERMRKKKSKRSKREYSSEEYSLSESDEDDQRKRRKGKGKGKEKGRKDDDLDLPDGVGGPSSGNNIDIVRKEMGLDWMLRPEDRPKKNAKTTDEEQMLEPPIEELPKLNPRELNPYLRDNGSGYPEEADQTKASGNQLLSSSVVGDGGASWRLKALKRAKEQAAREGRDLKDVVQDRWGDLGHLAVSVASRRAAAPRAHLHAIKSRKVGANDETESGVNQSGRDSEKVRDREYLKDVSVRHPEMRAPRVNSLSWGRNKGPHIHSRDAALISSAISGINKFANDGSFLSEVMNEQNVVERSNEDALNSDFEGSGNDASDTKYEGTRMAESSSGVQNFIEQKPPLSANQLAAKAMQLRLKGKHEEADKLLKEAQNTKVDQAGGERITKLRNDVTASRYAKEEQKLRQKGTEDDGDKHLAQTIMKNKKYSTSTQADEEYDYDGTPSRKSRRKGAEEKRPDVRQNLGRRIVTQQERCVFCFENPNRPKHLVVAIANFTYLMLPQFTPVAPGHCCIVTLQHEQATRMVDDNVWDEIRNFKKCLIMMFAKQGKELIFLETVLWLAQQRRHCLIECIPVPEDVAKDAPLYFKKAIDEAESEWSQHDAKKLIDTGKKGLRSSIPKNFPYFHVEFGLNKGFVHVIDDETEFKTSFGLNVVRGMLQTQDEDMYRRRKYETVEAQKVAVASFAKEWDSFDWTKQL